MLSLPILVTFFLSTLTLALSAAPRTSFCSSQANLTDVPNANNYTFTLLSVSKADTSVKKSLALKSDGLPGTGLAWIVSPDSESTNIISQDFIILNDGITAYAADGAKVAVSNSVGNESSSLSFLHPEEGVKVAPVEAYCQLFHRDAEYPYTLAVNDGDSGNFSLCRGSSDEGYGDGFVVIYKAVETDAGVETDVGYNTCYPVDIYLLPEGPLI